MNPIFVVSHVKNEEYMLKWWLQHHKDKFASGVIIDYASTDGTVDLVKRICPHWTVIQSRNKNFNALNTDIEVYEVERAILNQARGAYVIALNVTEYLIGDTSKLVPVGYRTQKYIPCDIMVDAPEFEGIEPDADINLVAQRHNGIQLEYDNCRFDPYQSKIDQLVFHKKSIDPEFRKNIDYCNRVMRSMHNFNLNYMETSMYGTGRHYWTTPCEDFRILWYAYSPYTNNMLKRKLAIQHEIPLEDKQKGIGPNHIVDEHNVNLRLKFHQEHAKNMRDLIQKYEPNLWGSK